VIVKVKQLSLIACLFLLLLVVIGSGLHLNPGGAFLAAATGTPLVVHFFNRRCSRREFERNPHRTSRNAAIARSVDEPASSQCCASEAETALRR
jgi:hypothetical protein